MRTLPTIAEIAERLRKDPPAEQWSVSLCHELHTRGEHEAAAMLEMTSRLLYETERAVLRANIALRTLEDMGGGVLLDRIGQLARSARRSVK